MDRENLECGTVIITLAMSLACEHLASITDKDASYWGQYFGKKAVEMLEDDNISSGEIERVAANALNGGVIIT
ncbi:MAG TPA: hypothetical protein DEV81_10595 [Cyanobacteria bacterium UBA11049]|nr:hypothetical protein [Cyanobacteria bacterium UBA11049]